MRHPLDDISGGQEESQKKESFQEFELEGLSENEKKLIREKKTTPKDIARERDKLKRQSEDELNELLKKSGSKETESNQVLTDKEYMEFSARLEDTKSAEETQKILEEIKDLPRKKEEEKALNLEGDKMLPPEDPKLLKLQEEFKEICKQNEHLIGSKKGKVESFEKWFEEERKKTPTPNHLKTKIKEFTGEIPHKNGLLPRKENFNETQKLYQKHGLSHSDCKWLKEEGFGEKRMGYVKNAKKMEAHLEKQKDTGFYSQERNQKLMKYMLVKAKSPYEQDFVLNQAEKVSRAEATNFLEFQDHMQVGGTTMLKMSKSSQREYLKDYKESNLTSREKSIPNLKKIVENEAKLGKKLEEIYKDDPNSLNLAAEGFQHLSYQEKEDSLKKHQEIVKKSKDSSEQEKELILLSVESHLKEAQADNTISAKTQKRYSELFKDPKNHKNEKTGKEGDLKTLKGNYKILIDKNPSEKNKNLAAYKEKRDEYSDLIEKLKDANPNIEDEEIEEWQNKYDSEGWTKRELITQELKEETLSQKEKNAGIEKIAGKAGLDEEDKKEMKEKNLTLKEVQKSAMELILDEQPADAVKLLMAYNDENPDNPKIISLLKYAVDCMEKFGSGKHQEESIDAAIEEEFKKEANDDNDTASALLELQIKEKNLEGFKMNKELHDHKEDSAERALKESLAKSESETETELIEDFYSDSDGYILDESGKGEEMIDINMEGELEDEERIDSKRETYVKQKDLVSKRGFTHVNFSDDTGREIKFTEAERMNEENKATFIEEKTEEISETLSEKAPKIDFSDLQTQVRARRKVEQLTTKRTEEVIKVPS